MFVAAHDNRTGPAGCAAAGRRATLSAADDGRRARVPAPRKPVDDRDCGGDVSWTLEHRPQAPGVARHTAQSVLEAWQVNRETVDTVLLVVSELVTNAVEHARPPLALHLHREHAGERVWVGVTDGGPAAHDGPWTSSCSREEHGRGLDVIDALSDAHGTRAHPSGITHWARVTAA
ncbi:ATP-binding protein [Streptomyces sp. SKN60]|uniref:ATP-binding protein n=1 Tax=Streptomyces sp. SKN60 TaxID=2855506 RepID=UPI002245380B|nr:ATP-binding protein [Streptomyces sp. SKN60]MCX2185730.1 ATP-binding protein [Streptomyces sp. SKN60]